MELVTLFREMVDLIKDKGGQTLKSCYQCGLCTACCPWNMVRSLPVHRMVREAQLGWVDFQSEDWWLCTTCNTCVKRCPRGVDMVDIMKAIRRILVPEGVVPSSIPNLRGVMTSIASVGNPWRLEEKERANWAEGLGVKEFAKGIELLYFPCCTPAYDPRAQKVAQATANILKKTGVDFGILGAAESCCGESVRKAGNESLFQHLAKRNIDTFVRNGVEKILVSSPHCYCTFQDEYPEFGGDFQVLHVTQYLAELLKQGRLNFSKELGKRVVYQDSCYLGRYHGIYDEPREVLRGIPGLELVEFPDCRENSFCCGGGGGRIWMETKKGERFSDLRLEEAIKAGAEVLAVACPYCMLNFEESVAIAHKTDVIEIKDISELVQEAL